MKLNGIEIPDDIEIPELTVEIKAEVDEVHDWFCRHHDEIQDDVPEPRPSENLKPVTISIKALRKLEPLARTKVLYMLRDQITP